MTRVRVRDNRRVPASDLEPVLGLLTRIVDRNLAQLASDKLLIFPENLAHSDDLSSEQHILRRINRSTYATGNVMGFLGLGSEHLTIASRFSSKDDDYFLRYLLAKVFDTPNLLDMSTDGGNGRQLFDLLCFIFPRYLKLALRKGIYKTYRTNHYNDPHFKGQLQVARHIRTNMPFTGNIAYSQREFTTDNPVTQLIRHVIELLRRDRSKNYLLGTARDQVNQIMQATPGYALADRERVLNENIYNPVRHAYFHEYASLQRVCILILQRARQGFDVSPESLNGVLFDGAWLWEEYLNLLVGDLFYHPLNRAGQGREYLFTPAGLGRHIGEIFPDFIGMDAGARAVADAKYKPVDNIRGRDYQQVLAYMFRFEASKGFLFYPESGADTGVQLLLNRGVSAEGKVAPRDDVSVQKLALRVPQSAVSYEEYESAMEEAERDFRQRLERVLAG